MFALHCSTFTLLFIAFHCFSLLCIALHHARYLEAGSLERHPPEQCHVLKASALLEVRGQLCVQTECSSVFALQVVVIHDNERHLCHHCHRGPKSADHMHRTLTGPKSDCSEQKVMECRIPSAFFNVWAFLWLQLWHCWHDIAPHRPQP